MTEGQFLSVSIYTAPPPPHIPPSLRVEINIQDGSFEAVSNW